MPHYCRASAPSPRCGRKVITGIETTISLFEEWLENEDFLFGDYNIHWLEIE